MNLALARAAADAVLYEGYLLYPYRASSAKNRVRWQFGVLGPPGAAEAGTGEESSMAMQVLLVDAPGQPPERSVVVHLRFLQLQRRQLCDPEHRPVERLTVGGRTELSWDEAVEREVTVELPLAELGDGVRTPVRVPGGEETEPLTGPDGAAGHVLRRRWRLSALITARTTAADGGTRLELRVDNLGTDRAGPNPQYPGNPADRTGPAESDRDRATRASLIGAHLIVEGHGVGFVSLLEPPDELAAAAAGCVQHRCWPVLTGAPGDTDLVLGSPIILYDYPEIAPQSAGALFDGTEIDEILTLRVMTMTEAEKAEARATDPRAREIIDRCDQLSPEALQQLHGVLRDPHAEHTEHAQNAALADAAEAADIRNLDPPSFETGDVPWWSPEADTSVQPGLDAVTIDGIPVARDSLVRVHPNRRADAQDLFFADQVARVTAVLSDVDGDVHVALVLLDDPAADLNDASGRYWYFAPDELSPLSPDEAAALGAAHREESRP